MPPRGVIKKPAAAVAPWCRSAAEITSRLDSTADARAVHSFRKFPQSVIGSDLYLVRLV